jgi:hypothetical protein
VIKRLPWTFKASLSKKSQKLLLRKKVWYRGFCYRLCLWCTQNLLHCMCSRDLFGRGCVFCVKTLKLWFIIVYLCIMSNLLYKIHHFLLSIAHRLLFTKMTWV